MKLSKRHLSKFLATYTYERSKSNHLEICLSYLTFPTTNSQICDCQMQQRLIFVSHINVSIYILCNSCTGKHKTQAMPLTTINTVIRNECKIYLGSLQNSAHLMVVGMAAVAVDWHLNPGKSRMLVMPTLPKVLESQILEAFTCNELSSTKPMVTSNIIT